MSAHNHDHAHGHSHSHSHNIQDITSVSKAFLIGIALNSIFTIIEFIVGYTTNSLALIADASHNLSDVASLIIALIGIKLTQKARTSLYTYGYKKASILASLVNAVLLLYIGISISVEAVERLGSAPEIVGSSIIITALIGVVINTVSAFLFFKDQKDDINIKGAFLHLIIDAAVSLAVVISGLIIHYTGLYIVDPITSFFIAIIVFLATFGLFIESLKLVLDGVPKNVDLEKVRRALENHEYIEDIHHLHIWALSSSQNALTVHIRIKENVDVGKCMELKRNLKKMLVSENIHHTTIEFDSPDYKHKEHIE